ncbi:tetratricopeptide repeat protein [Streptomyces sp. MP131-18]|uniref:tetratricopeptide repeat protein n=1 Tax=Streptomyces sp. MP131-18 TaxID=1857892 RepID=UPI00097C4846|nr:tetratricopeptide repeat protein [Streptomyces sp. MP131-18]ONK09513.1 Regulatory protein AfsR [Streptomyces sp. MP131-18]
MPFQVPPEPVYFADRREELARVASLVEGWRLSSRAPCVELLGVAGVGKTELAFRIARVLRDRYPDGVLYVDLDELRWDGAVDTVDALGELLRGLDVSPEWRQWEFRDRREQYWALTEGKRLLVIVDNARSGAEVAPLLPGSGTSLLVAISQGRLYDLDGGTDVPLSPLEGEDAAELLRRLVVDDPRFTAEPDAVAGIVRLCSGLPVAVHVAGRWVRKFPRRPLSRLLADLERELEEKGVSKVENVWDAAYQELSVNGALLYRLLADVPGATFTSDVATALLGRGSEAADDALEELEGAGLLDGRQRRMRLPELLRGHARRRARQDGGERERDDALRRIVRWYLRQAQRADLLAAGTRLTLARPVPELPGTPDVPFDGPEDMTVKRRAYAWLVDERHALYACVRLAHALGWDAEAWALCEPLWTHFLDHPDHVDAIEVFRIGVSAAQREENIQALARMRTQLARPLWELRRYEESLGEVEQALSAASALGPEKENRKVAASALEARGMLHAAQGRWEAAADAYERARRVHQEIPNAYGIMLQTYRLGEAVAALGEPERAAAYLREAHDSARELKRTRMTARTGFALGGVLRTLGRRDEARELYEAALDSARDRRSSFDEARILDAFAGLAEESGHEAEATTHREAARALRARNGRPA